MSGVNKWLISLLLEIVINMLSSIHDGLYVIAAERVVEGISGT